MCRRPLRDGCWRKEVARLYAVGQGVGLLFERRHLYLEVGLGRDRYAGFHSEIW